MWIASALSSDPSAHTASDEALEVYATKPNYEMASDRPLVLWECGFLPTDIEWRVGSFDGTLSDISTPQQVENLATASSSLLRMHKTWTQLAISTELSRHFVLASPSAHVGTLKSRTLFEEAAYPCLPTTTTTTSTTAATAGDGSEVMEAQKKAHQAGVIPLGNGTGRGAANYIPNEAKAKGGDVRGEESKMGRNDGKEKE